MIGRPLSVPRRLVRSPPPAISRLLAFIRVLWRWGGVGGGGLGNRQRRSVIGKIPECWSPHPGELRSPTLPTAWPGGRSAFGGTTLPITSHSRFRNAPCARAGTRGEKAVRVLRRHDLHQIGYRPRGLGFDRPPSGAREINDRILGATTRSSFCRVAGQPARPRRGGGRATARDSRAEPPRRERTPNALRLLLRQYESPLVLILVFGALVSLRGARVDRRGHHPADRARQHAARLHPGISRVGRRLRRLRDTLALRAARCATARPQSNRRPARGSRRRRAAVAGNLVPADGIVLEARDFLVSQAALTGESFPVERRPGRRPPTRRCRNAPIACSSARRCAAAPPRSWSWRPGSATEFGAHRRRGSQRGARDRVRARHPPVRLPADARDDVDGDLRAHRQPAASAAR